MEQKRMIDIDELRQELGFSENCGTCKQNEWLCQRDCYYSFHDFCARFDIAVDAIFERHKEDNPCDGCDRDCHMCGVTLENDMT